MEQKPETAKKECFTCKFYKDDGQPGFMEGYGWCLRNPERIRTVDDRTCGQYEPITPPEPIYTREQVDEAFMGEVWDALKADASDLGKQQRILAAFRRATYTRKQVQQVLEAAAEIAEGKWDTCLKCGHPRNNHPYRHQFQSNGHLSSAKAIRAIDIDAVAKGE